jgi:hypothetical protein
MATIRPCSGIANSPQRLRTIESLRFAADRAGNRTAPPAGGLPNVRD